MSCSRTQPYGNNWINYNQRYLKIPVKMDGLYRVNFTELNQAFANIGIPLSSIDPRTIQVFSREKEGFDFVERESDGKFDSTDYLMFYGKKNDGWFDKRLYFKPEYQVKPHYNLIGLPKPIQHFHQICIYAHGLPSSRLL